MLRHRLLTAAAILGPLLALLWADLAIGPAGLWLLPLALLATAAAVGEVMGLLEAGGHRVTAWTAYLGAAMVVLAAAAPLAWTVQGAEYPPDCPLGRLGWPWAAMGCAVPLAFLGEMVRYREPGGVIVRVALVTLTVAYVGLLGSFIVALRLIPGHSAVGMTALVSLVLVVKMSDTGAYAVGKLLGRRKLAPRLSPGKTVAGAVGGLAAGCLSSLLFFQLIAPRITGFGQPLGSWPAWLAYGALVTVAGMVGDLAESLLKRDMGRKDSSRWMPGLGGVLDVLDSTLVAAPVAYLCWTALLL